MYILVGMVLNINLGFTNLQKVNVEDPQDCSYALYIGDTIYVSEHSGVAELTGHSKKKINSVCIFFGEEESNELDQVQNHLIYFCSTSHCTGKCCAYFYTRRRINNS